MLGESEDFRDRVLASLPGSLGSQAAGRVSGEIQVADLNPLLQTTLAMARREESFTPEHLAREVDRFFRGARPMFDAIFAQVALGAEGDSGGGDGGAYVVDQIEVHMTLNVEGKVMLCFLGGGEAGLKVILRRNGG